MAATAKIKLPISGALPVCLFPENPNRLVSLWDIMELFDIWDHHSVYSSFQRLYSFAGDRVRGGFPDAPVDAELAKRVEVTLGKLLRECETLELDALPELITFTIGCNTDAVPQTNKELYVRLEDISHLFRIQAAKHRFFRMNREEAASFDNRVLLGEDVAKAFSSPETAYEITEAGNCYALGRYTATVFHIMRVLEKGLKALADKLSVQFSIPFDYQNWQTIIDQIEAKVRTLEKQAPGQHKTEELRAYSQIAKEFRYFKDAWRNGVAHSRETYTGPEALTILNHTREFMKELVKIGLLEK